MGGRAFPVNDLSRAVRLVPARFAGQIKMLEDLGLVPVGKITPDTVMTSEFLP